MEAFFVKTGSHHLQPASEADAVLLTKIKTGEVVKLKLTRPRNYLFHKKFFALLNFAFDYWEPSHFETEQCMEDGSSILIEKNFDSFRKDVNVLAGYCDATYRLNGDTRIEAKSISFGSMSEDEFEKLYSACIDVILKHICPQYTGKMLDEIIDQTMAFA